MNKPREPTRYRSIGRRGLALVFIVAILMLCLGFAYTILRIPPGNETQVQYLLIGLAGTVIALFVAVWGPLGAKDIRALGEWHRKKHMKKPS